jgi:putative ABC transport system permease protein
MISTTRTASRSRPRPHEAAPAPPRLPTIAILSYEYWQRRYGADAAVLGHGMLGAQGGPRIAGVLAPGFELLFPPGINLERLPDVWFAARLNYDGSATARNQVSLRVIGRLRRGVSLDRADAEVKVVAAQLRRNFPIKDTSGFDIRAEPMHKFLVTEVRPAILALMGAVIFLLLIACANVANLMLVRASLRERELAVRTALGGSRWRLVRQMLAETFLIAGLGALLGLGLAWAGIRELLAIAPANLPRLESIAINPAVLGFTAIAALIAAAIFGVAPAWRASRPDVMHVLRAAGRTSGLGGARLLHNSVVVAEVALSFVLLIGSGLMIRTFIALQHIDPGFDAHNLLTFALLGGRRGNVPQQRGAFMRDLRESIRTLPGVQSVTAAVPFPLAGGFSPIRWGKEEALADASKFQAADFQIVLPGYFETLRTPLIAGRTFTDDDNSNASKT